MPPVPDDAEDRLLLDTHDLGFSIRTERCIESLGAMLVGDLVQMTEHDLVRRRGIGRGTLREIKEVLDLLGLGLGMDVPGWARMKARKVWWPGAESSARTGEAEHPSPEVSAVTHPTGTKGEDDGR